MTEEANDIHNMQLKIDELTKQKDDIQNQLNASNRGVDGLLNQIEAYKALINDHISGIIALKSQLIGAQKIIKSFADKAQS